MYDKKTIKVLLLILLVTLILLTGTLLFALSLRRVPTAEGAEAGDEIALRGAISDREDALPTLGTQAPAASTRRAPYLPPRPPAGLTPGDRAAWLADRYWEGFDFADTTQFADMQHISSLLADYVQTLAALPADKAAASLDAMLDRAMKGSPAVFERFAEGYELFLYDPNSPLRNEELYIAVLRCIIASPEVDEWMKLRPKAQLETALRNRPGQVAEDFVYRTADGREHRLSQLRASYTLLFFYDPDCPTCRSIERHIETSETFAAWIEAPDAAKQVRLAVLAVYPDERLDLWRERLPQMPRGWRVGYDPTHRLTDEGLYDLRAIPTLYLLDARKRVIMKDASVTRIEAYLQRSAQ